MQKKTLILIFFVLLAGLVTACASNTVDEAQSSPTNEMTHDDHLNDYEIIYETGMLPDGYLDDTMGVFSGNVVSDSNSAIEIATAILHAVEDDSDEWKPFFVFNDKENGIWVVSFSEPNADETLMLGGDVSVVLQQKDGAVLKIMYGE